MLKSDNLSFIYHSDEKEKQTKAFQIDLTNKDKLLIIDDIKIIGSISDYLLGCKDNCEVEYKYRSLNSLYPKEREDLYSRKITIIDHNENKHLNGKENILSQLIKNTILCSDLKKNLYLDRVVHYKEKYKEYKKQKKEKIQEICKEKVLTIVEGTKEYKKILKENKNKIVIKRLEARNDFLAERVKKEISLENEKNKKELLNKVIRKNKRQAREEIEQNAKLIGIKSLDFLNKKYEEATSNEVKLINLLYAFAGNKDILIINHKRYDSEEMKIINKLLMNKNMLLIYITTDPSASQDNFTKVIKIENE